MQTKEVKRKEIFSKAVAGVNGIIKSYYHCLPIVASPPVVAHAATPQFQGKFAQLQQSQQLDYT